MNPNWKTHSGIMKPSRHSNSIGLPTILVIQSLTHREGVVLCLLHFAPIIFAIPRDRTPNLTTIPITTNHYTPYPKYHLQSRPSHSLMAVHLMLPHGKPFTMNIAQLHLGTSCISSPLYNPYLTSCLSHVFPLTLDDSPSSYRV